MIKIFTQNLHLKILALIFAVFLWFYVANEGYRVDYLSTAVPIQTYNIPENLALSDSLGEIKLKVRAPVSKWQSLQKENFDAYVDLKGLLPGIYELEIKVTVNDPSIQILEKNPQKVAINLEKTVSKIFPILVETSGDLGEGYIAGEAQLNIKETEVKGAESKINSISKVIALVEFAGEMTEVKRSLTLKAFDQEGNLIDNVAFDPESVDFTIPVQKETNMRTVGIKASIKGDLAEGYWIKQIIVDPSTITIQGNIKDLKNINYLETLELDITNAAQDQEHRVKLKIPNNISVLGSDEVLVKILLSSLITSKSQETSISFTGLDDLFKVSSYSPEVIYIIIEGELSILNNLKPSDIVFSVNLKSRGPGSYEVPISKDMVRVPTGVIIKKISPEKISVVINTK